MLSFCSKHSIDSNKNKIDHNVMNLNKLEMDASKPLSKKIDNTINPYKNLFSAAKSISRFGLFFPGQRNRYICCRIPACRKKMNCKFPKKLKHTIRKKNTQDKKFGNGLNEGNSETTFYEKDILKN